MRSWKTPALLATVGLCGLGSLFAQGPLLPTVSDPTPINDSSSVVSPYVPSDSEVVAPAPVSESPEQVTTPVYESAPATIDAPHSGAGIEIHSAPVESSHSYTTEYPAPAADPVIISSTPVFSDAEVSQPTCSCQGGGLAQGGLEMGAPAMGGGFGYPAPAPVGPIYTMGSGSGVAAGLLTPASNSGGLHTRYPYYNYRAPWFYQGPPSQNVTIVW